MCDSSHKELPVSVDNYLYVRLVIMNKICLELPIGSPTSPAIAVTVMQEITETRSYRPSTP